MKYPKIAFVIRQPGTANAFIPIIQLVQQKQWQIVVLAYENGFKVLQEKGIEAVKVANFKDAKPLLKNVQGILTGTSLFVEDDNNYWQWAKKEEIAGIAFVDSWVNYWQRFTIKKKWDATPSQIAVIDDLMKKRMLNAGASPQSLIITGSPAFDNLIQFQKTPTKLELINEILIITDPLVDLYGNNTKEKIGYTEFEVLDFIFSSLDSMLQEKAKCHTINIKIHPREKENKYTQYQQMFTAKFKSVNIITKTVNNINLIRNSKLVLGMNSILLLEASYLGKTIISIQPNRKNQNDITDGKTGISVFTDFEVAYKKINQELNAKNVATLPPSNQKLSTPIFIKLLDTVTNLQKQL